jgi:hypothetical protein
MSLPRATMPSVAPQYGVSRQGDAQTGPGGFIPFTPPRAAQPSQSYTSDEIRNFVLGRGWATPDGQITNPRAIYDEARSRGVGAPQLDQAGGWAPGTVNNYVSGQGWAGLGQQGDARVGPGSTIPFTPPTPNLPQPVSQPTPQLGPAPEHAALADAMIAQRTPPSPLWQPQGQSAQPGPRRGTVTPPQPQPLFAQTGQGVRGGSPYLPSGYYDRRAARGNRF